MRSEGQVLSKPTRGSRNEYGVCGEAEEGKPGSLSCSAPGEALPRCGRSARGRVLQVRREGVSRLAGVVGAFV